MMLLFLFRFLLPHVAGLALFHGMSFNLRCSLLVLAWHELCEKTVQEACQFRDVALSCLLARAWENQGQHTQHLWARESADFGPLQPWVL
jgi:hypothetical protein